jgi:uncharacterized SAM-binding protein YcdF (DUF218 family)
MSWLVTNLISVFLLPPLNLLLVGTLGVMLWYKRPRIARMLIATSLALLWLASTPYVADAGLRLLEGEPKALDPRTQAGEAIVVLGGGTYFNAPEYGGDTVSGTTLLRLRYAARLQRETGKPILVSGGAPLGNAVSEARQMKVVLEEEFKVPVQWIEDASANTFESARFSFQELKPLGIKRIYLVTQAWHMPRAVRAFQSAGFEVIPAPTAYTTHYETTLLAFLPSASALHDSQIFMHEAIGLLWYRLKSGH